MSENRRRIVLTDQPGRPVTFENLLQAVVRPLADPEPQDDDGEDDDGEEEPDQEA